jgi:hypothetical protein
MTIWGLNPFDDDDTIDFSYEIKRDGLVALARACRDARYEDSREEQHAEGFASAFIVASILTKDSEAVDAKTLTLKPNKELVEAAGSVVRVIREHGSDYLDRWLVFGEEAHIEYLKKLDEIGKALGVDPTQKTQPGDVLEGQAPAEQEMQPNTWENQRWANLQLLATRGKMKDDTEIERDVDHTFACPSEKSALAVVKSLEKDFAIEGPTYLPAEEGEAECWVVVATKSYAPDFENTWGYTLRMFRVAFEAGADYDGWGAPVIKGKKSWFGR